MDPEKTLNGLKMESKWTKNRPKVDQKLNKSESKLAIDSVNDPKIDFIDFCGALKMCRKIDSPYFPFSSVIMS